MAGEEGGDGQAADIAEGAQVVNEGAVQPPASGNSVVHMDQVGVPGEAVEQVLGGAAALKTGKEKVKPTPVKREAKVGPNDPCPCGSGKKYKKCCGSVGGANASKQ